MAAMSTMKDQAIQLKPQGRGQQTFLSEKVRRSDREIHKGNRPRWPERRFLCQSCGIVLGFAEVRWTAFYHCLNQFGLEGIKM